MICGSPSTELKITSGQGAAELSPGYLTLPFPDEASQKTDVFSMRWRSRSFD